MFVWKSEKLGDSIGLRQISKAIIAAFRIRNVLAKMMLDEIFEALKTDEEKNVQDILMWYFYTVFK